LRTKEQETHLILHEHDDDDDDDDCSIVFVCRLCMDSSIAQTYYTVVRCGLTQTLRKCCDDRTYRFCPFLRQVNCIEINYQIKFHESNWYISRFRSPHRLRRGSAVTRLLGLWVRIPPEAWISVCCDCYVLPAKLPV
jgi:hypothetical protein